MNVDLSTIYFVSLGQADLLAPFHLYLQSAIMFHLFWSSEPCPMIDSECVFGDLHKAEISSLCVCQLRAQYNSIMLSGFLFMSRVGYGLSFIQDKKSR